MVFNIIVAVDAANGIGKDGTMPWHLPADLAYFKRVTTSATDGSRNAVIMGRKTWESIPERFRPLPDRLNIVVSRQADYALPCDVMLADSLNTALKLAGKSQDVEQIFVIGGGQLYKDAISHSNLDKVFLTRIAKEFKCDTVFPCLAPDQFNGVYASNYHVTDGFTYCFKQFRSSKNN